MTQIIIKLYISEKLVKKTIILKQQRKKSRGVCETLQYATRQQQSPKSYF